MKLPLYVSSESKNNACRVDKARENECWMRSKSIECHHPTKPCNCQVLGIRSRFAAAEMSQPSHSTPRISAGSERLRQSRGRTERQALIFANLSAGTPSPMAQSPRPRAGGSERDLSPGRRSGRYFPCNAAQGRCRERSPAAEPTGTRERQHRGAPGFPPRSTPRSVPRGERGCSAGSDTSARGSGDPGRGSGCPAAAGTARARLSGEAPQWAVRGRGAPAGACPPARPPAAGCGRVRSARNRPGSDP